MIGSIVALHGGLTRLIHAKKITCELILWKANQNRFWCKFILMHVEHCRYKNLLLGGFIKADWSPQADKRQKPSLGFIRVGRSPPRPLTPPPLSRLLSPDFQDIVTIFSQIFVREDRRQGIWKSAPWSSSLAPQGWSRWSSPAWPASPGRRAGSPRDPIARSSAVLAGF